MKANEMVQNGIAVLDEHCKGDWWRHVNLDTLMISSLTDCMICQATGIPNYVAALEFVGLKSGKGFGFCGAEDVPAAALQVVWETEIAKRQGADIRVETEELAVA